MIDNVRVYRFRHVAVEDIMPKEIFPNFDSNAIEAYMHLIPGLSELFYLYAS